MNSTRTEANLNPAVEKESASPEPVSVRETVYDAFQRAGHGDIVEKHQEKNSFEGFEGASDEQPEPKTKAADKDIESSEPKETPPDDEQSEQGEDIEAAEPEDREQEAPEPQDKPLVPQEPQDIANTDDLPAPSWLRNSDEPDPDLDKEWAAVPKSIKARALKREAEMREGVQRYQEKAVGYDELEQAIGPRRHIIQKLGVSPAQVINQVPYINEMLIHPDQSIRNDAFEQLARQFGYDLRRLGHIEPWTAEQRANFEAQGYQYHVGLANKRQELQQQQATKARTAGEKAAAWSKGKQHASNPSVIKLVHGFLASGEVEIGEDLKNLDKQLDKAYRMAIRALELEDKPKKAPKSNNSKPSPKDKSVRASLKSALKQLSLSSQTNQR